MPIDTKLPWYPRMEAAIRRAKPAVEFYVTSSQDRSAQENWDISQEEARKGRDPWFLSDEEAKEVVLVHGASVCAAILADSGQSAALKRLGAYVVEAIRSHFNSSASVNGPMSGSPPGYVASKAKRGLDTRPMIATGQLRDSVRYRVTGK